MSQNGLRIPSSDPVSISRTSRTSRTDAAEMILGALAALGAAREHLGMLEGTDLGQWLASNGHAPNAAEIARQQLDSLTASVSALLSAWHSDLAA